MQNKKLFISAMNTLLCSWGSDAPIEAVWGANELLDWCEKEYGILFNIRFDEDGNNVDAVFEILEKML